MGERTRQKFIDSINRVTGRADCAEAVLLQQRNGFVMGASILAFVVMMGLMRSSGVGVVIAGAIAGGSLGLVLTAFTKNYMLGFCSDTIFLVRSSSFSSKPIEVVEQFAYPAPASVGAGMFTKKVSVANRHFLMARQFEQRFRSITGAA